VDTNIGSAETTGRSGVEAVLDIEFMKAVAPAVPLTVVYNSKYSLLDWTTQITNLDNSPLIHSVSYGNDERQQSSDAYMFSANTAFMKAGAQGLSILFASGDQGVCGREGCGGLFGAKRFKPDFPGGSPYITVVGGTDFSTFSIGDETAWSAGGGGFSDTFAIPDYQAKLVAAYKASPDAKLPKQSEWNNTGRGYPDVAALGGQKTPYCVVTSGTPQGVAGTSASCPTTASVFARLNGLRLARGGKAMGFLNPWIYQNPDAFNDVTSGCNNGGGFNKDCFTAIKGWDAATGNGTPNFAIMKTRI
jgi:tripeptidyl-peptidase-1